MTPTTEYVVGFSAGASACVYIYKQVFTMVREQKNGNGKVKSFAEDPDHYWRAMRENVTKPLSEVLDRQTRILEEQSRGNSAVLLQLAKLEERTRR